ncbi:MAG: hypothetical protein FWE28_01185 [Oscillospiraceae bacterium]|nr:hypothetical protein [Oscillospiraceae bacterium]
MKRNRGVLGYTYLKRLLDWENRKYVAGRPLRTKKIWKIIAGVGCVILVGITVALILSPSSRERDISMVMFGLSSIATICISIHMWSILITFEQHGIVYRTFWRGAREIPYKDIERYWLAQPFPATPSDKRIVVYVGKKKYKFESAIVGFEYLYEQLKENVGQGKDYSDFSL